MDSASEDASFGIAMDRHTNLVTDIATQIRGFHQRREQFRIYHGSTNSTRGSERRRSQVVDTSGLAAILNIDRQKRTALVEPNVSMAALVDMTLAEGLLPPVVMEFPAITVGGGFAGSAFESSSFRYGPFDKTVERIEIVLADGEIVNASATERQDLFHGAAGSLGTLGVITLLELSLIDAAPYVELTYSAVSGVAQAVQEIEKATQDANVDFVDGILFGLDCGVVVSGHLINNVPVDLHCQRYTRARDPWFYTRAEEILGSGRRFTVECVPTKDYLFRYDRGAFWMGAHAFRYFVTPFNIEFPFAYVEDFVGFLDQALGLYPLWLCPLQHEGDLSLHPRFPLKRDTAKERGSMLLNVGAWGLGPTDHDRFVAVNQDIERKARVLSGLKLLYAHTYYTEDEFWSIYDRSWYTALREKYNATSLPSVYEKTRVHLSDGGERQDHTWSSWMYSVLKEAWPLRGLYGVFHASRGSEYVLAKRA
ncbi:hypothetical protein LTR50_000043 [Elasticomyces elasticus]|nr:hypothetical protein LTR50_000043 [Elasticomyces elasticus]